MSLLMPDTPSNPHSSYSNRSSRGASYACCRIRYSRTPGSSQPGRVPIISPSSVLKPIVVPTLRPASSAHRLAPLPRWATIVRPAAARRSTSGSLAAMYS